MNDTEPIGDLLQSVTDLVDEAASAPRADVVRTRPLTLNGGVPTSVPAMRAKARQIRSVRADAATLARHTNLPLKVAHATIQLHYAPSQTRHRDPIGATA